MDLAAAEQANRRGHTRAKTGALVLFVLTGALLVLSLLMYPPGHPGPNDGAPGTVAQTR